MKLKLKVTVAYYEAKPNLFTHLLDSVRNSLLLWDLLAGPPGFEPGP